MLNTLRTVFLGAAVLCGLLYFIAVRKKKERAIRLLIAGIVLTLLGGAMFLINRDRIDGNRKALEASPVITDALKNATPLLISPDRADLIRDNGQSIREPFVLVPIGRVDNSKNQTTDTYAIIEADSCWSGGEFITTEQADQCKTILFYETTVLEKPFQTTTGHSGTSRSESKEVFMYDVETASIFKSEKFETPLPEHSREIPDLKVDTNTIIDWAKRNAF